MSESSSPLESLSDEILLIILNSVFTPPAGKLCSCAIQKYPSASQTILNIALCSRRLFKIAEPFLFHELTDKGSRINSISLQLLLCRILANPALKRDVHKIQSRAVTFPKGQGGSQLDLLMIQPDDWRRIREAVQTCARSNEESTRWIEAIEKGRWDGFIALLLSITPNLQGLNISYWGRYGPRYPFLTTVLERATELQNRSIISTGSLSNLKEIAFSYWYFEDGLKLADSFLGLPSITSFIGCEMESETMHSQTPENWETGSHDYPKDYNLRNLDLHAASMGPDNLVDILCWFPYLERLSYVHHPGLEFAAPPAIRAGLKHLKPYLQELTISSDGDLHPDDLFEKFTIGSLISFQKLRYVDMSQALLIGNADADADSSYDYDSEIFRPAQDLVTSLPPKLEHLCIRKYDRRIVKPVFDLIAQKRRYAPALKFLDLSWTKTIYPDKDSELMLVQPAFTKEEILQLLVECEAAGVEMIWTGIPPPEKTIRLLIEGRKLKVHFQYPYLEYKEWCEYYGCELETGKPASFDSKLWYNAWNWDGDFSKIGPAHARGSDLRGAVIRCSPRLCSYY